MSIHGFPILQVPRQCGATQKTIDMKRHFLYVADFISTNSIDTINLATQKVTLLREKNPENQQVKDLETVVDAFLVNANDPSIPTVKNVQDAIANIYKLVKEIQD